VPSPLTLEKIDHDMEFEWLLCLASRLQTYQRLRPTEIGGIQKSEEFPALTTQRIREGLNFGKKVSQPKARARNRSMSQGSSHTHKPC
jgi:hypothetical protein